MRASRAERVHYSGRIRIVERGTVTTIAAGWAACGSIGANRSSYEHPEVTCKRCLNLIGKHMATYEAERATPAPSLDPTKGDP